MTNFDDSNFYKNLFIKIPTGAILTGYLLFISFAYEFGFWSNYDISIQFVLSLLSPLDMVKALTIPFITTTFLIIFQLITNFVDDFTSADNNENTKGRLKYKVSINIGYAMLIIGIFWSCYKCYMIDEGYYTTLLFSYTITLYVYMTTNHYFKKYNSISASRTSYLMSLAIILPVICLELGHTSGKVPTNTNGALVMTENVQCSKNPREAFLLLGLFGSKGLSFSIENKAICLFNSDTTTFTTVHYNPSLSTSDIKTI